mgnify:CR=1 FL=1
MDKYIYDEKNGLCYELQGDYYLPCLKLPEERTAHIGIWGQRHLRYIRKHKVGLYAELLTTGKLNDYLADLNEQAEACFLFTHNEYLPKGCCQSTVAFTFGK